MIMYSGTLQGVMETIHIADVITHVESLMKPVIEVSSKIDDHIYLVQLVKIIVIIIRVFFKIVVLKKSEALIILTLLTFLGSNNLDQPRTFTCNNTTPLGRTFVCDQHKIETQECEYTTILNDREDTSIQMW
jgi:hypothetical protein